MQANTAAFRAWRRAYDDPGSDQLRAEFQSYRSTYDLLWSYFNNSLFDKYNRTVWEAYKQNYNLYRYIRPVRNPVRRLVNFYAGMLYPGVLAEDESELDEGIPSAMPFSNLVTPQVRQAVAQIWQWSNWGENKSVFVRYGAALGDVFLEVVDDLEKAKVYIDVVWPGRLSDLSLDRAGNVKSYILEYTAYDEEGQYRYRKEVDKTSFRYYRDDRPYDYGNGAEVSNSYGFVPGVWVRHCSSGDIHGAPAIAGSQEKIDELNNLVSQAHDQVKRVLQSPTLLSTSNPGAIKRLFGQEKRGATSEFDQNTDDRESILMFTASADTKAQPLLSSLDLTGTQAQIEGQEREIQKDHPELGFFDDLRQMSTLTGPAANRIVGDVKAPYYEALANYDRGSVAALQMCLSIAIQRVNSGAWGSLDAEQQKFAGFTNDAYRSGDLYLKFKPRQILPPTQKEIAEERQAMWTGVGIAVQNAGVPLEFALQEYGFTEQRLKELRQAQDDKEAQIQQDQMLAQEDVIPAVGQ